MEITVTVNGTEHTHDVEPRMLLVDFVRTKAEQTGTHIGCDTTSCGVCTVMLDGVPVKSCTVLAVQADGRSVGTVEGLRTADGVHPIQAAFKEAHGLQCGFCTPAMMLVGAALLEENPDADRRRGALGDLGQPLPLHRLHEHREGDPGRRRRHGDGLTTRRPDDANELVGSAP